VGVSPPKESKKAVSPAEHELAAARELVKAAQARGVVLTGPDGLLKAITKTVLESDLRTLRRGLRSFSQQGHGLTDPTG
jgi:hypothetical protein